MSSRVLIIGYYGFHNAGDDMILGSVLQALKKRAALKPVVLSAVPRETAAAYEVESHSRWNPAAVAVQLFKADILIVGGGGLFQDTTSSLSLYYYLAFILAAKILRKKVFVWAAGIGPLRSACNAMLNRALLLLADEITVRDAFSFSALRSDHPAARRVIRTADPALVWDELSEDFAGGRRGAAPLLPQSSAPGRLNVLHPLATEKNTIALCVKPTHLKENLLSLIRYVQDLSDRVPHLVPYLVPFSRNSDSEFFERLAMKRDIPIFLWKDITELADFFRKDVGYVISMRLHALLVAFRLGIPFVGVVEKRNSVPDKLDAFLAEIYQEHRLFLGEYNWDDMHEPLFTVSGRIDEETRQLLIRRSASTEQVFAHFILKE